MKPTTLHTLLFTILFFAVSIFSANAQLTYSGGRLSLDTTPIGSYKVSIAGNGAYFKLPSQTNFFQIDISSENTRLAGHGDQISFYNSSTNKYNSINVLNVYYHSDARAKTNVRDFSQGLEVISRIRPVTYNFINEGKNYRRSSDQEIGVLAQELEEVLPGAVITDKEGNKCVNYNMLIPVLIDAVKSLQAEVNALKENR